MPEPRMMDVSLLRDMLDGIDGMTPVRVVLDIPDDQLAEWGWDVDLNVEIYQIDRRSPHEFTITLRPAP